MGPRLFDAAGRGDVGAVQRELQRGAPIDWQNYAHAQWTVLMRAAWDAKREVVELLVERGADLDKASEHGFTALMLACKHGYKDVVDVLVHAGCDLDTADKYGCTALDWAARETHLEIVRLLLALGARREIRPDRLREVHDPEIRRLLTQQDPVIPPNRTAREHEARLLTDEDVEVQAAIFHGLQQLRAGGGGVGARWVAGGHGDDGGGGVPMAMPKHDHLSVWSINELARCTNDWSADLKLGEGTFGVVYRGRIAGVGEVAVKLLRGEVYSGAIREQRQALEAMFRAEVEVLGRLQHPNLVRLLGYAQGQGQGQGPELALVYELLQGGSLYQRLFERRADVPPLSVVERLGVAVGVARGLAYLHGQTERGRRGGAPVYHRDIKSANIGLTRDLSTSKLLDCGLAKHVDGVGPGHSTAMLGVRTTVERAGSPVYMAPELLYNKYGAASEIFSFGMCLLELVSGKAAHDQTLNDVIEITGNSKNPMGLVEWLDGDAGVWPEDVKRPLLELVNACLRTRAAARPKSMREVLAVLTSLHTSMLLHPPGLDPAVQAELKEVKTEIAEIKMRLASLEEREASLEAKLPPKPPAGVPVPQTMCLVCRCDFGDEDEQRNRGVTCATEMGFGHFTCQECLQGYVKFEVAAERLVVNKGTIACPYRGPGNQPCQSPPWEAAQLMPKLDQDTQSCLVKGLQHMVELQVEAADAARKEEEDRQKKLEEAGRVYSEAEKIRRYRLLLVEDYLVLKCPRCRAAWADYDGCDAIGVETRTSTCVARTTATTAALTSVITRASWRSIEAVGSRRWRSSSTRAWQGRRSRSRPRCWKHAGGI